MLGPTSEDCLSGNTDEESTDLSHQVPDSTRNVVQQSLRYVSRGRNPPEDPKVIKGVRITNKSRILSDGGNLYPATHRIWRELKEEHGIKKTSRALHAFVNCNKWNVKLDLGLLEQSKPDKNSSTLIQEEEYFQDSCASSSGSDSPNVESEVSTFKLVIPKEKWDLIKPINKTYRRDNDHEVYRKKNYRDYCALTPGIWTDVLAALIYDVKRLPCSWSFKGNYISQNHESPLWIKIRGKCGCGNILHASCPNPPPANHEELGIVLDVKIWGDGSKHSHIDVRKRKLTSEKRWNIGNVMNSENVKATKIRKQMASKIMDTFDPYPAHIPSNSVLRKAKHQAAQRQRLLNNPIQSLLLLKHSNKYQLCIQEIGLDPFYIHMCTPDQLKLYNLYCKQSDSRLFLDATGKVVQKIHKASDVYSKHIFLYLAVIKLPGKREGQIPVYQMLSERHNANAIAYWLMEWRRQGASIPKEVVLDDSAAIISAASRALGEEKSTSSYIEKSFQFLQGNAAKPTCVIRIDVAHFTKMIRKWPEIVSLKSKQKEFFIRCVVIVAKSKDLDEIKLNLLSIFITALSETEGADATGQPTPCEIHKKYLLGKISGIEPFRNVDDDQSQELDETIEDSLMVPTLQIWINALYDEAKAEIKDDGDRDNLMFSPAIVKKLIKLCNLLPLWCAAFPVAAGIIHERAIGAHVEGEFNNIKNRLITSIKRVDDFVREYLDIVDGSLKIASSTIDVTEQEQSIPSSKKDFVKQLNKKSKHQDFLGISLKTVSNKISKRTTCPLCSAGHMPDGHLKCKKCHIPIHKLNECSSQTDRTKDESYGESRICLNCTSFPSTKAPIIATTVLKKLCPVCSAGITPDGAHKCVKCGSAVHALDECSLKVPGQEEGYGELRLCFNCAEMSPSQNVIHNKFNMNSPTEPILSESTSLNEHDQRHNATTQELRSVEAWKGLSLPPKKKSGFYWRPNADYPIILNSEDNKSKIGILRNGSCSILKPIKIGNENISLANTCSFDAPCQIFFIAYCDSSKYRETVNSGIFKGTILDISKHLAEKGVNSLLYKRRTNFLSKYLPKQTLKGGLLRIDCLMDSSSLLKIISTPPSIYEQKHCNSPHCPRAESRRNIIIISPSLDTIEKVGIAGLKEALEKGGPEETTDCKEPLKSLSTKIPDEYVIRDTSLSQKALCAGSCSRKVRSGPHLLIELVGDERIHNQGEDIGVCQMKKYELRDIPVVIKYLQKQYYLRGVVAFYSAQQDFDAGHYKAFCLRPDNGWEMYDDLLMHAMPIKSTTIIPIHILIYSI